MTSHGIKPTNQPTNQLKWTNVIFEAVLEINKLSKYVKMKKVKIEQMTKCKRKRKKKIFNNSTTNKNFDYFLIP